MRCATASVLFENYAKAMMEYVQSTDKLHVLVGLQKPRSIPMTRTLNALPLVKA
jgi:hypothetical protein